MARVPVGLRLDADLMERLRNAIWHLGQGLTVNGIAEQAIHRAVEELERRNGGKSFPPRKTELPKSPKGER